MKRTALRVVMMIVCILFSALSGLGFAETVGNATNSPAEGIWFGTLKPMADMELRIVVVVTKIPGGALAATLRSIDQGGQDIPCDKVAFDKGILTVSITKIGMEIEGAVNSNDNLWKSEFRQGGGKFPLDFKRLKEMPVLNRPQNPKKPYPYNEEEVTYRNEAAGVTLAGTLTYPRSGGPFPAVILLTGSGQQNRDEEGFGHKIFFVLADYLTRQGIAVLRVDDRGIGGSTGDFRNSTTGDFADDALAGVAYLKTRKEIDPTWIGLTGHSEGGMIAPIAAAKSKDVAFIVMLAGTGQGFDDIVIFQITTYLKQSGMSEDDLALQRSWFKKLYGVSKSDRDSTAAANEIRRLYANLSDDEKTRLGWNEERLENEIPGLLWVWWRYAMAYNPQATLKKVKCPVLALIGEKDLQVPAKENLPLIEAGLKAGGNKHYLVKEIPGKNHLFQTAETGSETEYAKIDETMSPEVMGFVTDWIKDLKTRGPHGR